MGYASNPTLEEEKKLNQSYTDNCVKCKNCGHSIVIVNASHRVVCNWCGRFVFKTPKDEFIYRIKEQMIRNKRKTCNL